MTHQQFHPKIVLNTMEQLILLFKKNISCILVLNKGMLTLKKSMFSENKLHQPKNYLKSVITTSETHEQNITDKWGAEFSFSQLYLLRNQYAYSGYFLMCARYTEREELVKRQELINNSGLTLIIICNFKGLSFTKLTS